MKKTIEFLENQYVLHQYPAKIEVSIEDLEKLQKGEVILEELLNIYEIKYNGCSEPIYEDSYLSEIDTYEVITDLESEVI